MSRRFTALLVAAVFVVAFIPTQQVFASPTNMTTYTQYYTCIISPMPTGPVGVWTQLCNGSWAGWGMRPGDACTYTVEEEGESCSP